MAIDIPVALDCAAADLVDDTVATKVTEAVRRAAEEVTEQPDAQPAEV